MSSEHGYVTGMSTYELLDTMLTYITTPYSFTDIELLNANGYHRAYKSIVDVKYKWL